MKKINKAQAMKLIALIITIAILVIATIYMIPIIKQINSPEGQAEFKEKITNSGLTGMLILFGLELAQVVLAVLPGEPVELLAGICFGPIWGTIFLMISVFIVTAMIYFFVKKYGRDFIYEFFPKEKVNKLENSKLFKDCNGIIISNTRNSKRLTSIYRGTTTNKNIKISGTSNITKISINNIINNSRK